MSGIYPKSICYLQVETTLAIEMTIVFGTRADQLSPGACHRCDLATQALHGKITGLLRTSLCETEPGEPEAANTVSIAGCRVPFGDLRAVMEKVQRLIP